VITLSDILQPVAHVQLRVENKSIRALEQDGYPIAAIVECIAVFGVGKEDGIDVSRAVWSYGAIWKCLPK